jgi:hypothetical protein
LSGCLLFTDPVNKAPNVTIREPSPPITRGSPAEFTATVTDDHDSPASLLFEWAEFKTKQQGCSWITPATWVSNYMSTKWDVFEPYPFTAQSLESVCVCARATDHNGATTIQCSTAITPVNSPPVAKIEDVTGAASGSSLRSLCSLVHLSAEKSNVTEGDALDFNWIIQYSGSDPSAKPQSTPCPPDDKSKPERNLCFYAGSPGTYKVTLQITDSVVVNGITTATPSNLAKFDVPVDVDRPPCIQRTDPDVHAGLIMLSRSANLGTTYGTRSFTVPSVLDDCEPYPPASTGKSTQFVWWLLDQTRASPSWKVKVTPINSNSFTVNQSDFPDARPGDTIQLRVEVRDTAVQKYLSGLLESQDTICPIVPPESSPAICGTNDCVRWTTWTVQFEP